MRRIDIIPHTRAGFRRTQALVYILTRRRASRASPSLIGAELRVVSACHSALSFKVRPPWGDTASLSFFFARESYIRSCPWRFFVFSFSLATFLSVWLAPFLEQREREGEVEG